MSTLQEQHYLILQYQKNIYSKEGIEFQTFFENIMEKAYDDYEKIKPYGSDGDGGNDGYRKGLGIYYQVYSPKTPKISELEAAKKMYADYYKLKETWDDIAKIKVYYFVYNNKYDGSTIRLEETISKLEKENEGIEFHTFLSQDLEKVFNDLNSAKKLSLGFQIENRDEKVKNNNKFDKGLFKSLIQMLSSSGVVKFIKEQDFKGSFLHEYITPLIEFVTTWDNPEHEFFDPELEKERIILFQSAKQLANTIANKTTFINGSVQSVKPRHLQSGPTPDWVLRDGEEINQAADVFVDKHEKFVRLAKRKLYS